MTSETMIAVPLSLVEAAARVLDYARHPEQSEIAAELRDLVREQQMLAGLTEVLETIERLPKPTRVVIVGNLLPGKQEMLEILERCTFEHPSFPPVQSPPPPPIWSNDWRNKRGKRR